MSQKTPSTAASRGKVFDITADHSLNNVKPKSEPKAPEPQFDFDAYFDDDSMWGYKQFVQVCYSSFFKVLYQVIYSNLIQD